MFQIEGLVCLSRTYSQNTILAFLYIQLLEFSSVSLSLLVAFVGGLIVMLLSLNIPLM